MGMGVSERCAACAQDKSWRVRYNVAQQLYQLSEALGPDLARCVAVQPDPAPCSGVE